MKYKYLEILLYLGESSQPLKPVSTSTNKISKGLGISQQTISRKLREMENLGFIERQVNYKGHVINLTQKSITHLKLISKNIDDILNNRIKSISGTVCDGLGEGSYYLSIRQYKKNIKKDLGFDVFPGTLNIKVNKDEIRPFLSTLEPVEIKGFKTKERSFGKITCYKAKIRNIITAIVVPERNRYEDTLEVISEHKLRKKLNLKTGDKVMIKNIMEGVKR